jgi:GNAT superfamily N-acetyltransferase
MIEEEIDPIVEIDPAIEIFPAQASEISIASELRASMAKEMGEDWDKAHAGWRDLFVEYFTLRQASGKSQIFFARKDGNVIGMLTVSLVDDYHSHCRGKQTGRVNAVYVAPQLRRQGIARALMNHALDWLKARGCVAARLNSSEEGVGLYTSMGFKPRREFEFPL